MCSFAQMIVRSIFFFALFVVITQARPLNEIEADNELETIIRLPLISAHSRDSARKRHAEIRLSTEIGKRYAQMQKLKHLERLMANLDTNRVYSIQNSSADFERVQNRKRHTSTNAATEEIYPTAPSLQDVAPHLLQQLNGQQVNGGVQIKVINGNAPVKSPSIKDFKQMMQNAQNAVAVAKTCKDMQEMIARNNLKLRIRCQSESTRTNNRNSLSLPSSL